MKQNVAPWLGVCLPYTLYSRLPTGISILAVFQNLRWNPNKTSLVKLSLMSFEMSFSITAVIVVVSKDFRKNNYSLLK